MRTGSNRCSLVCKSQTVSMLWSSCTCPRQSPARYRPSADTAMLGVPAPVVDDCKLCVLTGGGVDQVDDFPAIGNRQDVAVRHVFGGGTERDVDVGLPGPRRHGRTREDAEQRRLGDRARGDPMGLDSEERGHIVLAGAEHFGPARQRAGSCVTTLLLGRFRVGGRR